MYQDKPPIYEVVDELFHYGTPRHSGRYPWGSGDNPFQHSSDFLAYIEGLKAEGMSEKDIAASMKLTTTQLRIQKSMAKDERRALDVATAKKLREDGYSLNEIAKQMGFKNDSSVRSLLNVESESRMKQAKATADFLRKQVDEKRMIDIGTGVERELNISKEKLKEAVYMLEMEGYNVYKGGVKQASGSGNQTNLKVLCAPDVEHKDIFDYKNIKSIQEYTSHDGGQTFDKFMYPASMSSKRIAIRYAEDGGTERDGLIELRRGVDDLSLGDSHYAQVRILVDGTHYLKGMAVYSDDLPPGMDIRFNTNKTKDKSKLEVMKPIKEDNPDNPFGALIKAGGQSYYTDKNGNRKLSVINKKSEEGDWNAWADKLPSQFLSKQNKQLIDRQLGLAKADKQAEYQDILALTNPTVKKALLKDFADSCDSAAEHLQAAALPRQKYQVILPVPSLKDNEVYAPNYRDGEKVALIRYPHGGLFEIPILTVNNKHKDSQKMIGKTPKDAICINSKVAERLSGADFDGDTVQVIPTNAKVKISSKPPLKELEGFDPKAQYPEIPGMKYMKTKTSDNTQQEMGRISNLITDMTLFGASDSEIARAVKHSMVVIDAGKHKLNYKQSEIDNGIAALKKRYQGYTDPETGRYRTGAGTIVSRASAEQSVLRRQGSAKIDPETGKQRWDLADDLTYERVMKNKKTGEVIIDPKTGAPKTKTITKTQMSTRMAEVDDAMELVSKTRNPKELAYADYANSMKALANEARKTMISTPDIPYSPAAKKKYDAQVDRLLAALNVAEKNAPRERQAQIVANAKLQAISKDNPNLSNKDKKKILQQSLDAARRDLGAKKETIKISELEWEAIQAGAISPNRLKKILNNADMDTVKRMAMPKNNKQLSEAKIAHIKTLKNSGYTTEQIANKLGVSTSTIIKYLS